MTDSHGKQPLSPAEFLKSLRKSKHKLRDRTALLTELMDERLNNYQIWRYLTEQIGITIGRSTANRFCNALRAGDPPRATRAPGQLEVAPHHATSSSHSDDTAAAAGEGLVSAAADTQCGTVEAEGASGRTARQHAAAGKANDASRPVVFPAHTDQPAPTIKATPAWVNTPPGERYRRYSSATPEMRAALRAHYNEVNSDDSYTKQGSQHGERTDLEK